MSIIEKIENLIKKKGENVDEKKLLELINKLEAENEAFKQKTAEEFARLDAESAIRTQEALSKSREKRDT